MLSYTKLTKMTGKKEQLYILTDVCVTDCVSPPTALSQGLQVASPTQSPNTFPQGVITTYSPEPVAQSGSGQLHTSGVVVSQAAPAPSTPVGVVANVLQHQLASRGGFVEIFCRLPSFFAGVWTNFGSSLLAN